jgi:hypothetical protein
VALWESTSASVVLSRRYRGIPRARVPVIRQ